MGLGLGAAAAHLPIPASTATATATVTATAVTSMPRRAAAAAAARRRRRGRGRRLFLGRDDRGAAAPRRRRRVLGRGGAARWRGRGRGRRVFLGRDRAAKQRRVLRGGGGRGRRVVLGRVVRHHVARRGLQGRDLRVPAPRALQDPGTRALVVAAERRDARLDLLAREAGMRSRIHKSVDDLLDRDRDGLLVFFVGVVLFRATAPLNPTTKRLVSAPLPVLALAGLIAISGLTPRALFGQACERGRAGGAICEDHFGLAGRFERWRRRGEFLGMSKSGFRVQFPTPSPRRVRNDGLVLVIIQTKS